MGRLKWDDAHGASVLFTSNSTVVHTLYIHPISSHLPNVSVDSFTPTDARCQSSDKKTESTTTPSDGRTMHPKTTRRTDRTVSMTTPSSSMVRYILVPASGANLQATTTELPSCTSTVGESRSTFAGSTRASRSCKE